MRKRSLAQSERRMKLMPNLVVLFLIFFFILAPRLDLKIVIHMGIFSVALIVMLVAVRQRNIFSLPRQLLFVAAFFLFLALYHLSFALIYGNDGIYFFSICISIIVSVTFGWLLAFYLFKQGLSTGVVLDQLLMTCAIVAILNATVVLIEYLLPDIKLIIESYLWQAPDGGIDYVSHPFRLRGLAGAGGATLSVFHALAVILLINLTVSKKIAAGFALFGSIVISCSNIFLGRTGLILSLLFTSVLLLIVLIQNLKYGFYGVVRSVGVSILVLIVLNFLSNFDVDPAAAGWAFEWVDGLSSGKLESASSDDLKSMLFLPDNPIHLLFGIGFFEGVGNIYPRSDSGYLKTILSIGVPLSVALYSCIIFMFFRLVKLSSKNMWLVISILGVMCFIEVKEPFFYQNYGARMIFLLSGAAMFLLTKRGSTPKEIRLESNLND